MTQASRPWTSTTPGDAGPYSQDNWALLQRYLCGSDGDNPDSGPITGSGVRPDPGLTVTQKGGGANMSVDVSAGAAMCNGTFYNNDAVVNLVIAANASGNPRVDTIVLNKDWSAQTVRLLVVQGTPAGSPVPTAMIQTALTQWQTPLADVAVANGAVSITNANITPRGAPINVADGIYLQGVLNNSGVVLQKGDVVIVDTSADKACTTTTTASDKLVLGIVAHRVAIGGYCRVQTEGIGYVNSSMAVTRGQALATSGTAKQAAPATSGVVLYSFATALQTTGGAGLVLCYLHPVDSGNLAYLAARPFATSYQASGANYALTAATTWTTIDGTNLAFTIVPYGTRVRCRVLFPLDLSPGSVSIFFDWLNSVSGLRSANNNIGTCVVQTGASVTTMWTNICEAIFTGLTPGTPYTFTFQYYKSQGTGPNLFRNAFPVLATCEEF